jgi:hypothetical protein
MQTDKGKGEENKGLSSSNDGEIQTTNAIQNSRRKSVLKMVAMSSGVLPGLPETDEFNVLPHRLSKASSLKNMDTPSRSISEASTSSEIYIPPPIPVERRRSILKPRNSFSEIPEEAHGRLSLTIPTAVGFGSNSGSDCKSPLSSIYDRKESICKDRDEFPVPLPEKRGSVLHFDPEILQQKHDPKPTELIVRDSQISRNSEMSGQATINEDNKVILSYMYFPIISLLSTLTLLYGFLTMYSSRGQIVSIAGTFFQSAAGIILGAWMELNHEAVHRSVHDAFAVYLGYRYAGQDGYSLATYGFYHSALVEKVTFAQKLKVASTIRKNTVWWSILYLIHFMVQINALFASVYMNAENFYLDRGVLTCLEYHQEGVQYDREWPNMDITLGYSEAMFQETLGDLRYHHPWQDSSYVMIPPRVTDKTEGDTIIFGHGYSLSIRTDCDCLGVPTYREMLEKNMSTQSATNLSNWFQRVGHERALINDISMNNGSVEILSLLTRTNVCTGMNITHPPVPICKTQMKDLYHAQISVNYIKQSNSASSFPMAVKLRQRQQKAELEWLYHGLVYLHGGTSSGIILAGRSPNAIPSMLKWTSHNYQEINPSLLDPGLEAGFAVIARAAIQRSFLTRGSLCTQTVVNPDRIVLRIGRVGYIFGIMYVIVELLYLAATFFMFYVWYRSPYPILPAIRFVHEKGYSTVLLQNPPMQALLNQIDPSSATQFYWSRLDVAVRVGESVMTGEITIDRPRNIVSLSWDKEYAL